MTEYTLKVNKTVTVRPSFLALIPGHLVNAVINDHLPAFEAALQEYIAQNEMLPFRMHPDQGGTLFSWIGTIRLSGVPTDFMLCGLGRMIDATTSAWEVVACHPDELEHPERFEE